MAFRHKLKAAVRILASGEEGTVVARVDRTDGRPQYLVRYAAADGRATECWWDDSAIEGAA